MYTFTVSKAAREQKGEYSQHWSPWIQAFLTLVPALLEPQATMNSVPPPQYIRYYCYTIMLYPCVDSCEKLELIFVVVVALCIFA